MPCGHGRPDCSPSGRISDIQTYRRYRNPQENLEWERCANELAAIVNSVPNFEKLDFTLKTVTAVSAGFCQEQGPIYRLRESLAQALW